MIIERTNCTFYDSINFDGVVKSPDSVIPAKAGIYNVLKLLDSGFRRNDEKGIFRLFTGSSTLNFECYVLTMYPAIKISFHKENGADPEKRFIISFLM
jgi:hypothetical protein